MTFTAAFTVRADALVHAQTRNAAPGERRHEGDRIGCVMFMLYVPNFRQDIPMASFGSIVTAEI